MEHFYIPCLSSCIRRKRFHQARLLLELQCVDVNSKDNEGRTALMEICLLQDEAKAVKMAKHLLKNGAKIGLPDKKGKNAFIYACEGAREKLVKLFIEEALNFDLNAADCHGNTALHFASLTGNLYILRILVNTLKRFKMSVDKTNERGETPLICASKRSHVSCVQYLVEEGKAATKIRDAVEYKTAEEWQRQMQKDKLKESYPSGRKYPESAKKSSVLIRTSRKNDICRPHSSSPERWQKQSSLITNYKSDLQSLFQIYEKQVSSGFLPGVVRPKYAPKKNVEGLSVDDNSNQDEFALTVGPNGCLKPRITARKNAKIMIDSRDLCKRRLEAPVLDAKLNSTLPFSMKRSQTLALAARFSSTKTIKDRKKCQSAKAIGLIGLSGTKCRDKFKNISALQEAKVMDEKLGNDRKTDNGSQTSATTHINDNSDILRTGEDEILSSNDDDDDDDDENVDLMTLSSPAALFKS